ncbi:unnamed protein product, partial [Prunus brigantina]
VVEGRGDPFFSHEPEEDLLLETSDGEYEEILRTIEAEGEAGRRTQGEAEFTINMVLVLPSEFSAPGGQVGGLDDDVAEEQLGQRPKTKEELLAMAFNEVNFLRRFISNLAGKIRPLTPLLRLKEAEQFIWETEHQVAFDDIKKYLSQPPVLMPPKRGKPLRLYISASESSIGCLLAQNNESEREQAVHYLSRTLNMAEVNYSPVEKLCLALYFAATKLRHYMLPSVVQIISKTDLIKYMLTRPIICGRIGKWTMALSEFTFQYVAQRSSRSGAGVVIESPQGQRWQFAFQLDFRCTNNQAEYEALIIGLEILQGMKATRVLVYGDSQLVINQLTGDYQCTSENLALYYVTALNTADQFSRISFVHIPRAENHEANEMAQVASGVSIPADDLDRVIRIEKRTLPALAERGMTAQLASAEVSDEVETADTDWRYPIVKYLRDPSGNHERTTRFRARCYLIYQNELYRK